MKTVGSTSRLRSKLSVLSTGEESGIDSGAVKCVDIVENTVAKAALWPDTDTDARKLGEQTGLDTLVVLAVNDGH